MTITQYMLKEIGISYLISDKSQKGLFAECKWISIYASKGCPMKNLPEQGLFLKTLPSPGSKSGQLGC